MNSSREKFAGDLVKKEVPNGLELVHQELNKITNMLLVKSEENSEFQNKTETFQRNSEAFQQNMEGFQRNSEVFQQSMKEFMRGTDASLTQILSEMGMGLERISAKWIRKVFIAEGVEHSPISVKHMLKDEHGLVHGKVNDLVEVDVFVDEPRTIIQCTTCLEKTEIAKLEKFALTKQLAAASSKDGQCKAYFVTYTVEAEIREEVSKIIEKTGIILINAEDII